MIKVYGLDYCPWSKETIDLLKKNDINFKMIWVTPTTKSKLQKKHKMQTFPQIVINNKVLGGYTDLKKYISVIELSDRLDLNLDMLELLLKEI